MTTDAGAGGFTADMACEGRTLNTAMKCVGTDASEEMLRYASFLEAHVGGVSFQEWDAQKADSPLQNGEADRVFAKLVFNYISTEDLAESVLPRLRECLNDRGLLVAVLPNPLREVGYSSSSYQDTDTLAVEVGNFGSQAKTNTYHHTADDIFRAAHKAGFAFGNIFGLPSVRFEPYRERPGKTPKLMMVADPMPLDPYVNTAKRWVYVLGATDTAAEAFDETTDRFSAWRDHYFPEIADIANIVTPAADHASDLFVPSDTDKVGAMYMYRHPDSNKSLACDGSAVENLSPHQKVELVKKLARLGLRPEFRLNDHLIQPWIKSTRTEEIHTASADVNTKG